jgi:hypothetical protein
VIAVLVIGIGVSWVIVDGANSPVLYRGGLLLHSAAAAAVVAALASTPTGRAANVLAWRPLVWVGVRSYGLYLWHWPVYVMLTSERTGLDGAALTFVRIAVSIALAAVSFRFVEDPIRHRATWVRDRRGIPALAGAVVLVATTLIVLPHPQREIAAFDPGSITVPTAEGQAPLPTLGPPLPHLAAPTAVAPTRPTTTSTIPWSGSADRAPTTSTTTTSSRVRSSTPSLSTAAVTVIPNTPIDVSTTPVVLESADTAVVVTRHPISDVLWTGDSIAYDLAPGVGAALSSAGLVANSSAYPGMRIVGGGEFSLLPQLRAQLPGSGIDVIVVQLSMWDADRNAAEQPWADGPDEPRARDGRGVPDDGRIPRRGGGVGPGLRRRSR